MVLVMVGRRRRMGRRVDRVVPPRRDAVLGRRRWRRRVPVEVPHYEFRAGLVEVRQVGRRVPGEMGGQRPHRGRRRRAGCGRRPLVMGGQGARAVVRGGRGAVAARGGLVVLDCRTGGTVGHVAAKELLMLLLVVPQPLVPRVQPGGPAGGGGGGGVVLHLPHRVEQPVVSRSRRRCCIGL